MHVLVTPPLTAEMVTVSPTAVPIADMAGVLSLVRLSTVELPRSLIATKSVPLPLRGVVSIDNASGALEDETLPARSVTVEVTDHVPSDNVGKSHDDAGNT